MVRFKHLPISLAIKISYRVISLFSLALRLAAEGAGLPYRCKAPAAVCRVSPGESHSLLASVRGAFIRRCACPARPRQRLIAGLWCFLWDLRRSNVRLGVERVQYVPVVRWTTTSGASTRLRLSMPSRTDVKSSPPGQIRFCPMPFSKRFNGILWPCESSRPLDLLVFT
jgi:hypothetical protein